MKGVRRLALRRLLAIRWVVTRRRSRLALSPFEFEYAVAWLLAGRPYGYMARSSRWRGVNRDRSRLLRFGFTTTASDRLDRRHRLAWNPQTRSLAAWYLGLWHASGMGDPHQAHRYLEAAVGTHPRFGRLTQPILAAAHAWRLVGDPEKAERILARHRSPHADLARRADGPIAALNNALRWYGRAPVTPHPGCTWPPQTSPRTHVSPPKPGATVSVLVATRNHATTIRGALESLLSQTYPHVEIIVADAGSDDGTVEAVKAVEDPRLRLMQVESARGISGARTAALHAATGTWVTSHDPHQWSHPERIALQVQHLSSSSSVRGVLCQGATLSADDTWVMDSVFPRYITVPVSSLMVSREDAVTYLGAWDNVETGAHAEWQARARALWGSDAVATIISGPVLLSHIDPSAAHVRDDLDELYSARGVAGWAREYSQQWHRYHEGAATLRYSPESETRNFPAPSSILTAVPRQQHLDVVLASDFGLIGGSTKSNVSEIEAMSRAGLTVGVMPMFRFDGPCRAMLREVQELIDGTQVRLLSSRDSVSTDLLEVRYPPVLQEPQDFLPAIDPRHVRIIVNQPPMSHYGRGARVRYDIARADAWARELWGVAPQWCPIGPQVRATLLEHHRDATGRVDLAEHDWVNIIDVDQWRRPRPRARDGVIRIGRHARDHSVKWLSDPEHLLAAYPGQAPFEVHVLGGAETPRELLGELPGNWTVHSFGALEPHEFLATIDVFVYYTHPEWVESFGRVVLEAMAVGVPAILPPVYEPLFGDAALYGTPEEVQTIVTELMADQDRYLERVEVASRHVERNYGYSQHLARITPLLSRTPPSGSS